MGENAKRAAKYSKEGNSQLSKNAAAQTLVCTICRQTFMCTQAKMLPIHAESKHPKNTFAECFPEAPQWRSRLFLGGRSCTSAASMVTSRPWFLWSCPVRVAKFLRKNTRVLRVGCEPSHDADGGHPCQLHVPVFENIRFAQCWSQTSVSLDRCIPQCVLPVI